LDSHRTVDSLLCSSHRSLLLQRLVFPSSFASLCCVLQSSLKTNSFVRTPGSPALILLFFSVRNCICSVLNAHTISIIVPHNRANTATHTAQHTHNTTQHTTHNTQHTTRSATTHNPQPTARPQHTAHSPATRNSQHTCCPLPVNRTARPPLTQPAAAAAAPETTAAAVPGTAHPKKAAAAAVNRVRLAVRLSPRAIDNIKAYFKA
jgi:hypothetical protein